MSTHYFFVTPPRLYHRKSSNVPLLVCLNISVFLFFANDPQFVWNCAGNGGYFSPFIGTNYNWFSDEANQNEVGEQFIELNITVK